MKLSDKRVLIPGLLILGLALGYGLGQSNAKTETIERTIEVENTVEVTPPSCLEALDLASEGFGYAEESAAASADALTAISNFDVAGIEAATAKTEALTEKVNALTPRIGPAFSECRAAA